MLNIEKHKEEIKTKIKHGDSLACTINELMGKECCLHCEDCYLNSLDWLTEEYKEPIFNDEEKTIIQNIISAYIPFGDEIKHITKVQWDDNECYLQLEYGRNVVPTPNFNGNELFTSMRVEKHYSLEELGL